jgi:glycosyltransferase involved in cell wall biosynthesis
LTEPVDVSVVVPSHNGAALLPRTLSHIAAQRPPPEVAWEVIVIDNASTDGTAEVARASWPRDASVGIRVVREPELGLSHAHVRGFAEARGELVSWVEDDNWISPDWLGVVWRTMQEHGEVGACGGFNEPVCEGEEPAWFEDFRPAYATGSQGDQSGYVPDDPGYLWGAGMTVRRDAWRHLVDNGFSPLLTDRRGRANYNSGGDVEISFALRLSGWRLWFEPALHLRHFLLRHRLEWSYLRRFMRGFGAASVGLDPYRQALSGSDATQHDASWMAQARKLIASLHRNRRLLWEMSRRPREGEASVMPLEFCLGRLRELLRLRRDYDRSFARIENAAWRRH